MMETLGPCADGDHGLEAGGIALIRNAEGGSTCADAANE